MQFKYNAVNATITDQERVARENAWLAQKHIKVRKEELSNEGSLSKLDHSQYRSL